MKNNTDKKSKKTDIKKSLTKEGLKYLKKYGKMPSTFGISDEHSGQLQKPD